MQRDIPFQISNVHYGLSSVKGTLYLESEFVVLDMTVKVLGMFDSPREIVKVEPGAFATMELDLGWLSDKLKLRARHPKVIEAVPGSHEGGVITLVVHRKYRDRVYDLLDSIELLALEMSSSEG